MKNEAGMVLTLMLLAAVLLLLGEPTVPGLVTVRGGLKFDGWIPQFDHCTIKFAVWRGNLLNEIPTPHVPYVYVDGCCHSHSFCM